jgi:hypothetical protein
MDSLFWKNLVPDIQVLPATKLFYKQYVYKLEMLAYAGKSVSTSMTVEESLAYRKISMRQINYGGSWAIRSKQNIKNADVEWLKYLKGFKQSPTFNCKIRIEEPSIQIYSDNEKDLYNFVAELPNDYKKYVTGIARPETDQVKSLMLAGKKVVKKPPTYEFKICFRDGNYEPSTRQSVLNYLDGLGNLVRIPKHFKEEFNKPYNNIWDCYIYSNDINIATFIQLINPNLIRSIIEMAVVDEINTAIIQECHNG